VRFIQLLAADDYVVVVNPAHIITIRPVNTVDTNAGSFVATVDGKSVAVKESFVEVQQKIADAEQGHLPQ
jgi:uncharacterized protein YlzI (FlbEa/FlbD family)